MLTNEYLRLRCSFGKLPIKTYETTHSRCLFEISFSNGLKGSGTVSCRRRSGGFYWKPHLPGTRQYAGWVNGPIFMLAVRSLSKAINIYNYYKRQGMTLSKPFYSRCLSFHFYHQQNSVVPSANDLSGNPMLSAHMLRGKMPYNTGPYS